MSLSLTLPLLLATQLSLQAPQAPAAPEPVPLRKPALTAPLSKLWLPLVIPGALLAPGFGHSIRGEPVGRSMLATSGVLFGSLLISGMALGVSGAADSLSAVGIPLALTAVGSYLVLGTADAIGAFSTGSEHVAAGVRNEAWNSPLRFGLGYVHAPDPVLRQTHYLQALAGVLQGRWALELRAAADATGGDYLLTGNAAFRLASLLPEQALMGEGLWLEAGVHQEWNARQRFDLTSLHLGARVEVPLLLLSPTLSRLSGQLRLGLRPVFGHLHGGGSTSSFELSGGYEVRWAITDFLRPYWGYEHARERLVGGRGTGFYGAFYAGAEVRLTERLALDLRGLLGTPATVLSQLEWRW